MNVDCPKYELQLNLLENESVNCSNKIGNKLKRERGIKNRNLQAYLFRLAKLGGKDTQDRTDKIVIDSFLQSID